MGEPEVSPSHEFLTMGVSDALNSPDQPNSLQTALLKLRGRAQKVVRPFKLAADPGHRLLHSRSHARAALPTLADQLVILTSNLWHDWPRHRRLYSRLESFAQLVESSGAEVILLQEVLRKSDLAVDAWLAERLGMEYVYARANGHDAAIGFEEGLAVFSRYPIKDTQFVRLTPPSSRFVNRWGLAAQLDTPVGDIWGVSVHLSMRSTRNRAQVHSLRSWVDKIAGDAPAVIGGDFNAHESTTQIARASQWWTDPFRQLHPRADGTTHSWRCPSGLTLRRSRLDYLFLRDGSVPWRVLSSGFVEPAGEAHSDHRAVITRAAFG